MDCNKLSVTNSPTSISFAITVCNELEELKKLINNIQPFIRSTDELLIQVDSSNTTNELKDYLNKLSIYLTTNSKINVHIIYFELNNNFALFKNNLKNHCSKNYIFFIDADELVTDNLLQNIHLILEANNGLDIILIPRCNKVINITPEHISRWGWRLNEDGFINYPDYQMRICKNVPQIKWVNKVHERLEGYKTLTHLPIDNYEWGLIHVKDIKKQEEQNKFYDNKEFRY